MRQELVRMRTNILFCGTQYALYQGAFIASSRNKVTSQ